MDNLFFITNRSKTLYETIKNLSTSTENIHILVGFFYFSGFLRLKEEIKDKKIKLLIGLDVEKLITGILAECHDIEKIDNLSIKDKKEKFYNSLINIFSYSNIFDNPETKEDMKLFVEKISDGTLEIRKTKEPNHAKLYLFENKKEYSQNGDYPGTLITGSSNLSIAGLEKRFEIDIISREKPHYIEAKKIFDDLWKDSIPIASKENLEEFQTQVLDKIWPTCELPTPYEVYIRVLKEYFTLNQPKIHMPKQINKNMMDLKYQEDAIAFAIETIKKHNGVIIADVVGLGKSIIASAVAYNLNVDQTIIISPPHLIEQWEYYNSAFKIKAKVISSGKIEEALKYSSNNPDSQKLIIVDEAHRYRNEDTLNYRQLWLLSQGNYVMLLTATPFNNTPQDIEALIKLFTSPKKSTLKHIDDLSYEFKNLISDYKNLKKNSSKLKKEELKSQIDKISKRIRYIISPITIRRTRIDLMKIEKYRKDLEKQGITFPKVNPPDIISYSFNNLDELYLKTIEKFVENSNHQNCFTASRYKAISYIKDQKYLEKIALKYTKARSAKEAVQFIEESQKSLSSLIRRIFIKRFESSFGSFEKSIDDYIKSHKKILQFYKKDKKIPIYKNIEQIPSPSEIEDMDEEEKQEILQKFENLEKTEELIWIASDKLLPEYEKDLENDIKILEEIKDDWSNYLKEPLNYDYKLKKLIEILKHKTSNKEKIIIFSEYSDTVDYLYDKLSQNNFKVIEYHSKIADEKTRNEIEKNFDASLSQSQLKDDYDILITTDILSEGINLHRANNIINYDIPYNPTRVIQRIGRVNRISKLKLKDINIYNFFPTKIGETHTKIQNISTLKMHMIHFILGEDIQYLTTDEEIKSYFYEEFKNSPYFEEESWDVKYRNLLYEIEEKNPQLLKKALKIPLRTRIRRAIEDTKYNQIVFARKGNNFIFKAYDSSNSQIKTLNDEEAIKLFQSKTDEKPYEVTENFYKTYDEIKKQLFTTQTLQQIDRSQKELTNKIDLLKEKYKNTKYESYLLLLKEVIELEVIPQHIAKDIKDIDLNSENPIEELIKQLPDFYLKNIIKNIKQYNEKEDIIILSEEFVPAHN